MTKHFQPPSGGTPTRAYRRRQKSHKGFERRRPLSKSTKGRIVRYLAFHTRWQPGGRAITDLHVKIIRIMLFDFHNDQNGRCDPSQASIAKKARCNVDTVRKALYKAEELGVASWCHRWFRGRVDGFQRVLRTSNGYIFTLPDIMPGPQPARVELPSKHHKPKNLDGTSEREYYSLKSSLLRPPTDGGDPHPYLESGRLNPELIARCPDRKPASSAKERGRRFAPLFDKQ